MSLLLSDVLLASCHHARRCLSLRLPWHLMFIAACRSDTPSRHHGSRKIHIPATRRKSYRRQIVKAAHAKPPLQNRGRDAEVLLPIRDKCDTAKMAPGGMAADVQPIGVPVERRSVLVNPRNGAAH